MSNKVCIQLMQQMDSKRWTSLLEIEGKYKQTFKIPDKIGQKLLNFKKSCDKQV